MGTKSLAIYPICFPGLHDDEGLPLSGGKAYFYDAGTTTPKDVYTDRDKSSIASQPVILDTYGRAEIYGDGLYKVLITDAADATVYDLDNVEFIAREGGSLDDTTIGLTTPAAAAFTDVDVDNINASTSLEFKGETVPDRQVLHNQTINASASVLDWVYRDTDDEWIEANGATDCQGLYWKNTSGDKIVLTSGYATGFTGLTSGSTYYLKDDGTLTTNIDMSTNKIKVGVAYGTTSLIVDIDNQGGGADVSEADLDVLNNLCEIKKFGFYQGDPLDTIKKDCHALAFQKEEPLVLTVGGAGYAPPATTITLTNTYSAKFNYPVIGTIYSAASSGAGEDIVLLSDNGSNVYTLSAALSGSYASSTSYVKLQCGTIQNNRLTYLSGADVTSFPAKNARFHSELIMEQIINKKFISFGVFEPGYIFNVSSFSSATQTVLLNSTGIDLHNIFTNGSKAVLFKIYQKGDKLLNVPSTALASNFKILSISASSGATNITLTHDACAVYGTSEATEQQSSISVWYVVPLNMVMKYFTGAIADTPVYSEIIPSIFKVFGITGITYPSYVHSHWRLNELSGNALNAKQPSGLYNLTQVGTVPTVVGGSSLGNMRGPFTTLNYFEWNSGGLSNTIFDTTYFAVGIRFKTSDASGSNRVMVSKVDGGWSNNNHGWAFYLNSTHKLTFTGFIYAGGYSFNISSSASVNDGLEHYAIAVNMAGTNNCRLYLDGAMVAQTTTTGLQTSTANLQVGNGTNLSFPGLLGSGEYWSSLPATMAEFETIMTARFKNGVGAEYGQQLLCGIYGAAVGQTGNKSNFCPAIQRYDTSYDTSKIIKAAACYI